MMPIDTKISTNIQEQMTHLNTVSTENPFSDEPIQVPTEIEDSQQTSEILQLPPPNHESTLPQLQFGETLKLEGLGPVVVNVDGSLSTIANWDTLTPFEQKNTLRIISARNKKRIEALKLQYENNMEQNIQQVEIEGTERNDTAEPVNEEQKNG